MLSGILKVVLSCLAGLVLVLILLISFGVSDQPDNQLNWSMRQDDLIRAKKILHEGSKTRPDEIGKIELSLADLNLAGNYLLNRFAPGKAVIALKDHKIRFAVTTTLPENAIGKYVNISFRLGHEDNNPLPVLTKFKAGKLLLPSKVAAFIIEKGIEYTSLNDYFLLATDPIQGVDIDNDKITITYHQSQAALNNARDLLTHDRVTSHQAGIYQAKIAEIVNQHDPNWRLSLADLIKPMFALALQESTQASAVEENRAAINAINDYVNAYRTGKLPTKPYYPAFLYKRIDLAQHFIGAAAITASVNSQMAQVLGEEKELQDARRGSGFSFIDLAADKAGARFGEIAVASPESARALQQALANINGYSDFMPDPTSLPEHMDEMMFKKRYGGINSAAYQKVSKQIDALIAATPLYKK